MKYNERWLTEALKTATTKPEAVAAVIAAINEHDDGVVAVGNYQLREATRIGALKDGRNGLAASGWLESVENGEGLVRYRLKFPGGLPASWPGLSR